MKRYNVLKDCIIGGKFWAGGTVVDAEGLGFDGDHVGKFVEHGFLKEIKEDCLRFKRWNKDDIRSELAKVLIAPEDYVEDEKKYFTWEEACAVKDRLGNGWRLPTRSEWVLICEEFGQKDGYLNADTLVNNLGLEWYGWQDKDGALRYAGLNGLYWASTAYQSELYAYCLAFNSARVLPSDYNARWNGFTVRLVKDLEEK